MPTKVDIVKAMVFSSSHVWMWELGHKEGRGPKNWCLQIVVLEKTIESPLDCKEIQPVNPKRNQPWIFTGRTDVKAESPILWPPDAKNWLIWKDPNAGKDWEQEKTAAEDGMVGWHHQLKGHESEVSHSVMSNCLQPHGLYSPWNSLGQNIAVDSHPLSKWSSQPKDQTQVSHIAGGFFTSWATREASVDMSLSKLWEIVKDKEARCSAVHGITKNWIGLSNWATTNYRPLMLRPPATKNGW